MRLFILMLVSLTILFAVPAEAAIDPYVRDAEDQGCSSVDTGTGACFGYDANTGTASGMTACTAHNYCVTCERYLGSTRPICVEARRNAECKCKSYETGPVYCIGSGACTYNR